MKCWLIIVIISLTGFALCISYIQAQAKQFVASQHDSTMTLISEYQYINNHWCWREICLGQTTRTDAWNRLQDKTIFGDLRNPTDNTTDKLFLFWGWTNNRHLSAGLVRTRDDDKLSQAILNLREDTFSVADAHQLFGTPEMVYIQGSSSELRIEICYPHSVCVMITRPNGQPKPAANITRIDFYEVRPTELPYGTFASNWHGFRNYMPRWLQDILDII